MAAQLDRVQYAGDSNRISAKVLDVFGSSIDLTDAMINWYLSTSTDNTDDIILTKSTDDDSVLVDSPVDGTFTVQIDPIDTMGMDGIFYHEAVVTTSDAQKTTVFFGTYTVVKHLTSNT